MSIATLINPAILSSHSLRFSIPTNNKPNAKFAKFIKAPPIRCDNNNGGNGINGHPKNPSPIDNGYESPDDDEEEEADADLITHNSEIWRLFTEAQENIMYLHKQRVRAVEELQNANREKRKLLDKIKQLDKENKRLGGKDTQALCWELLLRIDSMVLGGNVSTEEASDLRRRVIDSKVSLINVFPDLPQQTDAQLLAELRHFSDGSTRKGFHIIHICTEMEPLVSVGPVAQYVTGLSRALQTKGHLVEVILPKYASLDLDEVQGLREIETEYYSYFNGQLHGNKIWTGVVYGIGVTFIQPSDFSSFFNGERIYDYPDDFERFTYFSRASLDYIAKSGKRPDVLHLHNWQTAIVGSLFWDIFAKQGLVNTGILLTCHGFDSQCLCKPDKLALCGLDPGRLYRPDRLQDTAKTHLVNILKGGIVYSNRVIIMSSMYSKGMIIHSTSHGLESTLTFHEEKLLVAPYGFDNSTWDPSKDRFLPFTYTAENMRGKRACKFALQQQAGLSARDISSIVVGCIISEVSDFDLEKLKAAVRDATKGGAQFVFVGNGAVPTIKRALRYFQEAFEDSNVKFLYSCDEALSHLVFAGSDIILCQSLDDPLLQVPLKALRYGAAPVLEASGDNYFRYFADRDHQITRFSQFMLSTFGIMSLTQALDEMTNSPLTWETKIMEAMKQDFSWDSECYETHVSAYTSISSLSKQQ